MKRILLRAATLFGLVSVAAGLAPAAQSGIVVILHQGDSWQLQGVEKISINGKSKIRRSSGVAVDPNGYKQDAQENIGAGAIRLHRSGYMVERVGTGWAVVVPDGASVKAATTADKLWGSAQITVQADKSSKPVAYRPADVFAILPGSDAATAAVAMLTDEANFTGVGEKSQGDAFDERMSMLVGVSGIVKGAALDQLKKMLAGAMDTAVQRSNSGSGRYAALLQGLGYSSVSQKAFPADPDQTKLRNTLRDKKAFIDRRVAILKAFSAASEWDPLIDKYGDFEEYDEAFADLHALHDRAFKQSEAVHTNEAKRLYGEKQLIPALDQVKLARLRNPGSRELQALFDTIRLEEATTHGTVVGTTRKAVSRVGALQILNSITVAENYMNDGKFSEAEGEIVAAEAVDASDPRIVLTRAKLLRARKDLTAAIEMLDKYDRLVSSDTELADGTKLRAQITYEMRSGRDAAKTDAAKAEDAGDYLTAIKVARAGLQLDPGDPDLLYRAGIEAAITRNPKDAKDFWQRYLTASQSLSSEGKRRTEVLNLMPQISEQAAPSTGVSNWFSNYNSAADAPYDPASLMPNAHAFEAKGPRKMTTVFDWSNGFLRSIRTSSPLPTEPSVSVYFDYRTGQRKGVRRVATEPFEEKGDPGLPRVTADGAVGSEKGTYVVLDNDPDIDPVMIEKLTGKRVATIVSGNPYFNPFIWDGVYVFLAEYDANGHVKSAKAIRGGDAGQTFDFVWQGDKLMSITERGPRPGTTGDYRRELHYNGNRLIEETVVSRGRTSKVNWRYNGDRLSEVEYDEASSMDGKARKFTFEAGR